MLWLDEDPNLEFEINTVLESIDEQPTIDAEPVRRWIPVTERLPKRGRDVLVARGTFGYGLEFVCFNGTWLCDGEISEPVTHWMPLPELPIFDGGVSNEG
jgi:hypothetical protein